MQLIFLGQWPRDHRYKAAILEGTPLPELDKKWKQIEGDLARVRDAAEKNGWRVGVVILPPRDQVDRDYPQATYQIKVSEIAERLGFFTIDPLPTLVAERARVNQLFLPYDFDHPSPAGHRIIAEMIAEYFAEHPQLLDAAGESLGFLRGIPTRSVSEGAARTNVLLPRALADASG
jgi:hypothetical protein